jgi:hypothetical protein
MAKLSAEPRNQKWLSMTDPLQVQDQRTRILTICVSRKGTRTPLVSPELFQRVQ